MYRPANNNSCLVKAIEEQLRTYTINQRIEDHDVSLLRVRVVSSRTAPIDRLRKAILRGLANVDTSNVVTDSASSPVDRPTKLSIPRSKVITSSSSFSSSSSVLVNPPPPIKDEKNDNDTTLFHTLAAYLIARHRRAAPRLPPNLLNTLTTATTEYIDNDTGVDILRILSHPHQGNPTISSGSSNENSSKRNLANNNNNNASDNSKNTSDVWSDAGWSGHILQVYQSIVHSLVIQKPNPLPDLSTTESSVTSIVAAAVQNVLSSNYENRNNEYKINPDGTTIDDTTSTTASSVDSTSTNNNTLSTIVSTVSVSWSIDNEANNIMRLLYHEPDLVRLLAGGSNNGRITRLFSESSFIYGTDRGLLSLHPVTRDNLGIQLVTIELSTTDSCIGDPVTRWIMDHIIGYDTAVLNAVLTATKGNGYVMVEHSGEIYALSAATEVERFSHSLAASLIFKLGTLSSAIFLVFSSSSLVSFILAQTQARMLRFTAALQIAVHNHYPLLPLIASHVIDSLVFVPIMLGVLFFLCEFFIDQLLAALVLIIVWICELWGITACRTVESIQVFPRIFGLVMTFFHVYYLSYPFGYQYLCLSTCCLGLLSCMWHLWNQYEYPALEAGAITFMHPRATPVRLLLASYASGWIYTNNNSLPLISSITGTTATTIPTHPTNSRHNNHEDISTDTVESFTDNENTQNQYTEPVVVSSTVETERNPSSVENLPSQSTTATISNDHLTPSDTFSLLSPPRRSSTRDNRSSSTSSLSPQTTDNADINSSPLVKRLRAVQSLVQHTAEAVMDSNVNLSPNPNRHDRHDRLSLGGWT